MSKACESLKIERKYFAKRLTDEQKRLIKEAKAAMAGAGVLKIRRKPLQM